MPSPRPSNQEIAVDFLNLIIAGTIDMAYEKYVAPDGKHHNVFFPAGFNELRAAMKANHIEQPHKKFAIKQVIAQDDQVAVRSHLTFQNKEPGMIVVHWFRFEQGKIVELWDCGQAIPANQPNADGAF